ncbi:MAG: hypothetical protein IT454_16755 [Planctomycetes bacterium]|nr:hypothetical protein [Planctomycetota bacterium]
MMLCLTPFLFVLSNAPAPAAGDQLVFDVAAGSKVHKRIKAVHELRIDDMGVIDGDLPYVSDKSGGWVSATMNLQYVDEYARVAQNRPLEFVRTIREAQSQAKANVTRSTGQVLEEGSRSSSPLRKQNIRFTWIDAENDWARSYERIDAEEPWLAPLRGEFELLALLPKGEVAVGDTWQVPVEALVSVLAPGGNLQLVPSGENLFGRLTELGVGGDFADFFVPAGGSIEATYKGRREVGDDSAGPRVSVGVVELQINVVSSTDRAALYRMAMPQEERREVARLDGVPFEYTLIGTAELLWDFAHKRAHSLRVAGQEGFSVTVQKTRFDGREEHRFAQQSRYSGPLTYEVTFSDGAALESESELDNPKLQNRPKRK